MKIFVTNYMQNYLRNHSTNNDDSTSINRKKKHFFHLKLRF